jgi:hypothetical protein
MTPGAGTTTVGPLSFPSGYFFPGSPPTATTITLTGSPIPAVAPGDTIVRRHANAVIPNCPGSAMIPIEIVALSLVSVSPIVVGGRSFNARVCLDELATQPLGSMTITRTHLNGGTFTSSLPVIAKLTFTEVGGPAAPPPFRNVRETLVLPNPTFPTPGAWVLAPIGALPILQFLPGLLVDGNCDGVPETIHVGTTNFFPAVLESGSTCGSSTGSQAKQLTAEQALLASHGVLPTNPGSPPWTPPPFPGAGSVLATQPIPSIPGLSPDILGMAYDRSRLGGVVWLSDQNRTLSPLQPSLFSITRNIVHSVLTTIVCLDSACISTPNVPRTTGQFNGLSIVPSRSGFNGRRTLLAVDFNGDVSRFDDHLVEIDPDVPAPAPGAANLRSVWYLDSTSCPATCAPNTNTNVPARRIDPVIAVQDMDYIPGEAGDSRHQVLLVAACGDYRVQPCNVSNPGIHFVQLTEGCPGTWQDFWATGTALPVMPFQWNVYSMHFDPDTQSYWVSDVGNGAIPPNFPPLIYEVRFDSSNRTFRSLQAFPAWDGQVAGNSVLRGTNLPRVMKSIGRRSASIAAVVTGEQLLTLTTVGPAVQLTGGAPNAGKPWLLTFAFSANFGFDLPDRERRIGLDPDVLFLYSVAGVFGNSGVLDGTGSGQFLLPPVPSGAIRMQAILLGNPNEADLGVDRISNVIANP